MPTQKSIILLQENGGQIPLDISLPESLVPLVEDVIDEFAETFEDLKTELQGAGRYDTVHLLTDNACTRANLLDALVDETKKRRVIDLIVLGHGNSEKLQLKGEWLEGDRGARTIASLLPDARDRGVSTLNLRMVYMCNCYASTVNDDWLAIGAKVSIGSKQRNMMPEPMTTFFIQNWLSGQKAKDSAKNAYEVTIPFFLPIYRPRTRNRYRNREITYPCPTLTNPSRTCRRTVRVLDGVELIPHSYVKETELIVGGDGNEKF